MHIFIHKLFSKSVIRAHHRLICYQIIFFLILILVLIHINIVKWICNWLIYWLIFQLFYNQLILLSSICALTHLIRFNLNIFLYLIWLFFMRLYFLGCLVFKESSLSKCWKFLAQLKILRITVMITSMIKTFIRLIKFINQVIFCFKQSSFGTFCFSLIIWFSVRKLRSIGLSFIFLYGRSPWIKLTFYF